MNNGLNLFFSGMEEVQQYIAAHPKLKLPVHSAELQHEL